ncbi:enoyl-CoA hydratase-related protein [Streptomyces sp. H27-D2]|uniref:enoyl-CoA hydratase-related protein n=1 Tax=Streptomyces sp. H27-D2 TaxID=3046304 RepID=UPI002DBAAFA7|nr:enoyl-CoA hydratase-related protein [Streptomyces sp. H27-D2]MEC4019813.1 enoyl-CoA hydratase-related protein [Streptomyces sp. H27-D2]
MDAAAPTRLPPGGQNAIAEALGLLGDEWTLLILRYALQGTRRYQDWRERLPISHAVLSARLTRLTDAGLLARDAYQQRPVRYEYRLTPRGRCDVRAVIWRGEGASFSSGRDVGSIGTLSTERTHHELMRRGHRGIQQLWELDAPVLVACKGWVMGGSFQRALLCDVRIAAEGTRFRLPELGHGVIPDTGGVAVLHQMCGPGVVSDLVLTCRVMNAGEALAHGVVSRVVPADQLDDVVREAAEQIAAAPKVAVKLVRENIRHLSLPEVRASMADEMVFQTFLNKSDDYAEFRAARTEGRAGDYYTGS